MILWMKKANNFQIAKVQPQSFAQLLLNFFAKFIFTLLINKKLKNEEDRMKQLKQIFKATVMQIEKALINDHLWMKKVNNNFQIAKVQPQGFAQLLLNFFLSSA